jgi:L-fucose mutarotase
MIKAELIHPEILSALGKAGHGSQVLITDGDYPVSTTLGKNASVVHLNLSPGVVNSNQVLTALLAVLPVEAAMVMDVPKGRKQPEIWADYQSNLNESGNKIHWEILERFKFYQTVASDQTALVIQTGETREYANLLLTIGSLW